MMTNFQRWAEKYPEKVVLIKAETGEKMSASELNDKAEHTAKWMVSLGLKTGDTISLLLENRFELLVLALAAERVGLYYTVIITQLAPLEIAYILKDNNSKALFLSAVTLRLLGDYEMDPDKIDATLPCYLIDSLDQENDRFLSYPQVIGAFKYSQSLPERPIGLDMLYSSGTTGRPKGIRRPMNPAIYRHQANPKIVNWQKMYHFDNNSVYLSTGPLYHAAPLRYTLRVLDVGGSCVIMEKFDAKNALMAIDKYHVTHSQWVPTMFIRMLNLPIEVRDQYNVSTLQVAIHAAAPCPIHVKLAMLNWWGDIIYEYYAGSENIGVTMLNSQEWRAHQGSVGRAVVGVVHIVDDDGNELPANEIGNIYFSGGESFGYHNDAKKTKEAYNDKGWATYGDIGYLDEDGFLYLSDRRADLILSGGVNVYPQEIENVLLQHPAVEDVAVVGVPNDDFGEVPKAIICLKESYDPSAELAEELINYCSSSLARYKWPRTVVFDYDLPRLDTGKLLRRILKERYRVQPQAGFLHSRFAQLQE